MLSSLLKDFQHLTDFLVYLVSKLKGVQTPLMMQVEGFLFFFSLDQNKTAEMTKNTAASAQTD